MSNPTVIIGPEIADTINLPASSFPPANTRVTSNQMPLSVLTDVPIFPGPVTVTGTWTVAGNRVTAAGIGIINTGSIGIGYNAAPASSGALKITPGNQNVTVKF